MSRPALHFYDTLSRRKVEFRPLVPGEVRMYHCGPTVYQRPHVGNYRAFLFADLLRRTLERWGLRVTQVMNLTDVGHLLGDGDEGEDRMEKQARKEGTDPWQIVERVAEQFFADLKALGVQPAHHYPRATAHVPEMLEMIRILLANGHAYRVGENVYLVLNNTTKRMAEMSTDPRWTHVQPFLDQLGHRFRGDPLDKF